MGYAEPGKNFCFQITTYFNGKTHKILFSTVYKNPKKASNGVTQMPL